MWTKKQIQQHERAALLLNKIKDEAFAFISKHAHPSTGSGNKGVTEWQVHEFILARYKKYGLVVDKNPVKSDLKSDHGAGQTIVAFGENTQHIHYYPDKLKAKSLKRNEAVMLDIWARLKEPGAPYADITWMAYYAGGARRKARGIKDENPSTSSGDKKVSREIQKVFDVVIKSRDECLEFIRSHAKWGILPTGKEADTVARSVIADAGYEKTFRHSTGHGLGLVSPHWRGRNLSQRNKYALLENIGYTIEPGIYLEKRFGCRSEMNFYITEKGKVIVTTPMQRKIVLI